MNSVQRFLMALRREEPDRVPVFEAEIHPDVITALLPGGTYEDFVETMDLDAVLVVEDVEWEEVAPYVKRDQFGTLRDFREMAGLHWPVPLRGPIEREADLDSYVPPDPADPARLATLRAAVRRFKGEKAIIFVTFNGFLYPAFMRGMENLLMDYLLNPGLARRLADLVVDYYVELARRAIEAGADVIWDSDDYCGRTGPIMSPAHFAEFVLPGLRRLVQAVKDRGVPFVKHMDGNVWPILEAVVDVGVDGINPIEPAAGMDIGEVKRAYGSRVAVIGNIDCSHLLTFGSPERVREAVRECIRVASPGGGHILCSSNTIHQAVPARNYAAMLEAAKEFGRYPIR